MPAHKGMHENIGSDGSCMPVGELADERKEMPFAAIGVLKNLPALGKLACQKQFRESE